MPPEQEHKDFSSMLDKWCEFYMSIGVTYDEYWNGDTEALKFHYEAERQRIKKRNFELWLQGAYIYEGVSIALSNAFAKRGATPKKYVAKPYDILPKTDEEIEADRKQEQARIVATLNAYMNNFNARKKK